MRVQSPDQRISSVTALRCQACGHEWPEICELPMELEAFIARTKAWCICPKCGNKSRAKGKTIVLLQDDLYRQAVDKFMAEGRVPKSEI